MRKFSKLLSQFVVVIFIIALAIVSFVMFAPTFAKYVSNSDNISNSARPAAFKLVMDSDDDPNIEVSFAADGEPGNPIGYSTTERNYDFSVQSIDSEASSTYTLTITFEKDIAKLIAKARANKYQDGLLCDFEVYEENSEGVLTKITAATESGTDPLVWSYTKDMEHHQNPNGTTSGVTKYRLKLYFYNNTLMPSGGNASDYGLYTDGINITVSSQQKSFE